MGPTLYEARHKNCGGLLGFYHGDPAQGVRLAEFFRLDGSNPVTGGGFHEVCPRCHQNVDGIKHISWLNPSNPAEREEPGLADWGLMAPDGGDW